MVVIAVLPCQVPDEQSEELALWISMYPLTRLQTNASQ